MIGKEKTDRVEPPPAGAEAPIKNATSRGLRREPLAGARGLQVAGFKYYLHLATQDTADTCQV